MMKKKLEQEHVQKSLFRENERKSIKITAIPEEPFNNKVGSRVGKSEGSFWELSKLGTKSTYKKCNIMTQHNAGDKLKHGNHVKTYNRE